MTDFHGDDFSNHQCLIVQLISLQMQFEDQKGVIIYGIVTFKVFSAECEVFPEVVTLLKLILVNPTTSSISKCYVLPYTDLEYTSREDGTEKDDCD